MSDKRTWVYEFWCGSPRRHDQHWIAQRQRCRGVTGDESAVMLLDFECGPHPGTGERTDFALARNDAERVIEALDKARGNN